MGAATTEFKSCGCWTLDTSASYPPSGICWARLLRIMRQGTHRGRHPILSPLRLSRPANREHSTNRAPSPGAIMSRPARPNCRGADDRGAPGANRPTAATVTAPPRQPPPRRAAALPARLHPPTRPRAQAFGDFCYRPPAAALGYAPAPPAAIVQASGRRKALLIGINYPGPAPRA
jgi:hypothetical protein